MEVGKKERKGSIEQNIIEGRDGEESEERK